MNNPAVLALLPLLPWIAATLGVRRMLRSRGWSRDGVCDWRDAVLLASLFLASGVVVVTETLGLFHALKPGPLRIVWGVAALGSAGWLARMRTPAPAFPSRPIGRPRWDLLVLGGATCLIVLLALVTAAASPPAHPDVLGYHLPRQLMWLQQGGLDFYATSDQKQLRMPPFSEMVGLQLLALSGGDAYANLPEFACYLLSAAAVSVLVRDLGGGRRAQVVAVFLWAALPIAYQEASSGKNDLMTALWVAVLAWLAIHSWRGFAHPVCGWLGVGCALGLSGLTKGTGVVYSAPIVAFLAAGALRRGGGRRAGLLAAAAVAVVLCGGHYLRNLSWYGTPLGHADSRDRDEMNQRYTPAAVASNLVRNLALELPVPSARVNRALQTAIERIHRWMAQDVNDPRTSLVPTAGHYEISYQPSFDSLSSAGVQTLLCLALPFWMWARRHSLDRTAWLLLGFGVAGAVAFAAAAKWQPWGARLQLPLFALAIPLLGLLAAGPGDRVGATGWLAAGAALVALLPALNIYQRPLWGDPNIFGSPREEIEYRFWPSIREPQRAVGDELLDPRIRSVRFAMEQMNWAYPVMRRLLDERTVPPVFWGRPSSPAPDAVVVYPGDDTLPVGWAQPGTSEHYWAVGDTAPYLVYVRASLIAAGAAPGGLPSFIGWSRSEGLAKVMIGTGRRHFEGRVASGGPIRLLGPFEDRTVRLRAAVRVLRRPAALQVEVNGSPVAEVRVVPGETREFDVAAPGAQADGIVIRPSVAEWGERDLIFLRLQVVDPAGLPSAWSRGSGP